MAILSMLLSLAVLWQSAPATPAPVTPAQSCRFNPTFDQSDASWRDRYVNIDYQYEVRIPRGFVAYNSPPPNPQHGFGIRLGAPGQGYLWVDGSWNSAEHRSAREAAEEFLGYVKSDRARILDVKHERALLGSEAGDRMLVRYQCPGDPTVFVYDYFVMLSARTGIVYTIALDTPLTRYAEDRKVQEAIIKSWKLRPEQKR